MTRIRKECDLKLGYKSDDDRIVTGYASTDDVDRQNDIVEPSAFAQTMPLYMKNPIMFFGHDWWNKPIGKILDYSIKEHGLWIKAQVSKTADDIWQLIKEGILKTFSIGFDILDSEDVDDKSQKGSYELVRKIRKITKLELYEISIVNIPANPQAVIESAKSLGIELKSINAASALVDKSANDEGAQRKDGIMPKELKELETQVTELDVKLKDNIDTIEKAGATLKTIQESIKDCVSAGDLKALEEKSKKDLIEAVNEINKTIDQKTVMPPSHEFDVTGVEQAKRLGFTKDLDRPDVFKSRLIESDYEKASNMIGMQNQKHILKELQIKSDDLFIIGATLGMIRKDGVGGVMWTGNPTRLKTYNEYIRLLAEVHKAIDTGTSGEGADWLPTGYSSVLQEGLEVKRGVIKRIPRFSQPTQSYVFPLLTADATPYLVSEATSDSNANTLTASTPTTSSITFTSHAIGGAVWNSKESEEDLIIAVIPLIKANLQKALVNGEEDACINGDNATTHQDTDTAAGSAALVAKAFDGFRYDALNTSGASYDMSGTLTYAKLLTVMEKAGKYAMTPGKGFFITSIAAYYKILGLSEFTGYSNFDASTVSRTGILPSCLGHDIIPTETMRQDLGPAGVNAASDNVHTAIIFVNPDGWLIGDRRRYTVEQDNYPLTQQRVTVATERIDMQKMVPSSHTCTSIGYNITT